MREIIHRKTGEYRDVLNGSDSYRSFIPKPLPPNPEIEFDVELDILVDKANRSLGRLDGVTSLLPNTTLFTSFYIMKEALLSSQIEGTQSTFSDILLFENEQIDDVSNDTQEVMNYVSAFRYGISKLIDTSEPQITIKLLTDIHQILLADSRGSDRSRGQIRECQNWVGGIKPSKARFVPPPPDEVMACLVELENFLNNIPSRTPVLLKAALAHVQFETIHPFEDGNGRIGRLLIVLLLCMEKALSEPMLYLSLYFKVNYAEYIERLQSVREQGDWESWLKFFFQGILEVSQQAVDSAQAILELFDTDRRRIESMQQAKTPHLIHTFLQTRPIVSIKTLSKELDISIPSITSGLHRLEKLGIVQEKTGFSRNRLYSYSRYISLLSEGTNPVSKG